MGPGGGGGGGGTISGRGMNIPRPHVRGMNTTTIPATSLTGASKSYKGVVDAPKIQADEGDMAQNYAAWLDSIMVVLGIEAGARVGGGRSRTRLEPLALLRPSDAREEARVRTHARSRLAQALRLAVDWQRHPFRRSSSSSSSVCASLSSSPDGPPDASEEDGVSVGVGGEAPLLPSGRFPREEKKNTWMMASATSTDANANTANTTYPSADDTNERSVVVGGSGTGDRGPGYQAGKPYVVIDLLLGEEKEEELEVQVAGSSSPSPVMSLPTTLRSWALKELTKEVRDLVPVKEEE